ncbi:hypothetical protein TIFTF001_021717 [Ficus carica]|uniref:Uncharacterized protein n=1 Tax=Ficus carica TaxID=3494 RepID=A0AA88AV52_FICCA|nr:hypothetical protein TIFTF001_021717 [Ficus carica]
MCAAMDERPAATCICGLGAGCSGPFNLCSLQSGSLWPDSRAAVPIWRVAACSQVVFGWNDGHAL